MVDRCSVVGRHMRWEFGAKIISGGTELKWGHIENELLT
jgi:hypothetical protein